MWGLTMKTENRVSVWVGGVEVNNYQTDRRTADHIANLWVDLGHTDVVVWDNINEAGYYYD